MSAIEIENAEDGGYSLKCQIGSVSLVSDVWYEDIDKAMAAARDILKVLPDCPVYYEGRKVQ